VTSGGITSCPVQEACPVSGAKVAALPTNCSPRLSNPKLVTYACFDGRLATDASAQATLSQALPSTPDGVTAVTPNGADPSNGSATRADVPTPDWIITAYETARGRYHLAHHLQSGWTARAWSLTELERKISAFPGAVSMNGDTSAHEGRASSETAAPREVSSPRDEELRNDGGSRNE